MHRSRIDEGSKPREARCPAKCTFQVIRRAMKNIALYVYVQYVCIYVADMRLSIITVGLVSTQQVLTSRPRNSDKLAQQRWQHTGDPYIPRGSGECCA